MTFYHQIHIALDLKFDWAREQLIGRNFTLLSASVGALVILVDPRGLALMKQLSNGALIFRCSRA
jgi:hypothetical protein